MSTDANGIYEFEPTAGSTIEGIGDVGVVILSYGPDNAAVGVIGELCRDGRISPEQILEVHNPSAPGERVSAGSGQQVLNLSDNVGYAGGMNAGIAELAERYAYVLLLTHDVRVDGGAIERLRAALEDDPRLAIVGPVLTANGEIWSAGKKRMPQWTFLHIPWIESGPEVMTVDSLDGSVLLVRSSALDAVRFDPRFFMYYEETDFIERLRSAGCGEAAVVTSTRAESFPGGTTERPLSNAYLMARNGLWVATTHGGLPSGMRYGLTELVEALRLVLRRSPEAGGVRHTRGFEARRLAARAMGLVDAIRRRFGPPPQRLRDGDLNV